MTQRNDSGERFPRELEILRQMADNIPQIVWVTRPDGVHEYYNRKWYEFTGFTPATSTEDGWSALFHPDDLERVNAAWAEALSNGTPYEIEFRLKRGADGIYCWFLGRALPYHNAVGEIVNWFGTCTDIQGQKLAEQALRGSHDEIRDESRRKDEFLGMISHELRTPLNAVFGWTRLMQENLLNEKERADAINSIIRNAEAQARLIEDVIDITRIVNQKLSLVRDVVNVLDIVRAAMEAAGPEAEEKDLTLRSSIEAHDLLVDGDAMRLQQVVSNVLGNAVKFTPRGGSVRLRAARDRGMASIEITDTGKGIAADLLPHIFERFRQGDSSSTRHHGGLGLGLTIARELAVMHGGRIEVESAGEGQGSRFTIRLPIVAVAATKGAEVQGRMAAPEANVLGPGGLRGFHVMVVDDEASVRDLLALTLEKCGASVTVASSAETTLSLLASVTPDVIICDIAMPGMDGYAFVEKLRLRPGPAIPAIALTAYASTQDRARALDLGFDGHLAKPVDPAVLVRAIVETRPEKLRQSA